MRKFLDPSEISSGFSRFAFAVAGYPGTFGLRPRARECHARTPVLYRLTVFSRFRRKSNAAVVVEGKLVVIFAREFGDLVQTSEDTSWLAVERGYADTAPRVLVEDPSLWTHEEVSHEPAGQTHRRRPLVGDGDERRVPLGVDAIDVLARVVVDLVRRRGRGATMEVSVDVEKTIGVALTRCRRRNAAERVSLSPRVRERRLPGSV